MHTWILFPVQIKELSLVCLCQRNWFLLVSKLMVWELLMVGSACRTSCCDTSPALISHSDRNAHSAAGQLIWCSCEYTRHNQILINEKSRAPVATQSFHVSTSPLRLVTWPWLVIPISISGYAVLHSLVRWWDRSWLWWPVLLPWRAPSPPCAPTFATLTCKSV